MLNYKTATNEEINSNGIVVKEISPTMKLNLRGKKREFFTNIGKNLNLLLPTEANTSTISDKLTAIWLSPDEWMIITNDVMKKDTNEYQLNEILFNDTATTEIYTLSLHDALPIFFSIFNNC